MGSVPFQSTEAAGQRVRMQCSRGGVKSLWKSWFRVYGLVLDFRFSPEGQCQVLVKVLIQRDREVREDFFVEALIFSLSLSLSPPPLSRSPAAGVWQRPAPTTRRARWVLLACKDRRNSRVRAYKKKVKELKSKKDGCFSLAKTVAVVESMPNYKYCNVYFICRL
jgi:hypothetical protein